ncbi:MAG: hypothetical protein DLM73_14245 [Chthoniobacterales bacterium]|nr:MAG: hypothetical protein DLM73_14245 [Chthoniobacterales bacterium]
MLKVFFLSLLVLCSFSPNGQEPSITKVVFRLIPASPPSAFSSITPKTIYVAGDRYARIEEQVDLDTQNLIIVSEPDIWVIDGKRKHGSHMVNPGPDLSVHNPILGPEGPAELFDFEYGRELRFFANSKTIKLGFKEINGVSCDVRELRSGDYRIIMNIIQGRKTPHSVEIFVNDRALLRLEYVSYEEDLPFDRSLFGPPLGIPLVDSR